MSVNSFIVYFLCSQEQKIKNVKIQQSTKQCLNVTISKMLMKVKCIISVPLPP